jgi:hypothetical protein
VSAVDRYCEMCESGPRPATWRVAAPSGPERTEDPQVVCCGHHRIAAMHAVYREEFVTGPPYIDPL